MKQASVPSPGTLQQASTLSIRFPLSSSIPLSGCTAGFFGIGSIRCAFRLHWYSSVSGCRNQWCWMRAMFWSRWIVSINTRRGLQSAGKVWSAEGEHYTQHECCCHIICMRDHEPADVSPLPQLHMSATPLPCWGQSLSHSHRCLFSTRTPECAATRGLWPQAWHNLSCHSEHRMEPV